MITLKYADSHTGALLDEFQSIVAQLNAVLKLTAEGQLELSSIGSTGGGATVAATLVQGSRGTIKSIQRGTISITAGNTSNTATITAVDTNKAQLISLGWAAANSTLEDYACRIVFTNATTITAIRGGGGGTAVVGYQVIEWN